MSKNHPKSGQKFLQREFSLCPVENLFLARAVKKCPKNTVESGKNVTFFETTFLLLPIGFGSLKHFGSKF